MEGHRLTPAPKMREIRFKYNIPGFKCRDSAVKNRKMFENKGVAVRASNAGRHLRFHRDLLAAPPQFPPLDIENVIGKPELHRGTR